MMGLRDRRSQFSSAPLSVAELVSAIADPLVAVVSFAVLHWSYDVQFRTASAYAAILVLTLMFPGINRFGRGTVTVIIDIATTWFGVILVLALTAIATRSLGRFDADLLVAWAVITPIAQLAVVKCGSVIQARHAVLPGQRRRAVIVGANGIGIRFAERLKTDTSTSYEFVGFFDDRSRERINLPAQERLAGTLAELPSFIDLNGVKDVYITLPLSSQPRIIALIESLQNTTASLHFVPDVFAASIIQGRLEDVGGIPVVSLSMTPFTGADGLLKRLSDIVLSVLILMLVTPLLLAIAIGVKLSSPGPVIFRQKRTGLDGEMIEVYKFRSMTVQDDGPVIMQASRKDVRVTPFGAFIRRTSLDELPQFFNVLQGRMSIVGPRPHAVAHNIQYRALVRAYMARHKVKPGITGWAQVNGYRGATETLDKMERRVEYDLEYLRNWSIRLDLLIIARTVRLVFFDRGAF